MKPHYRVLSRCAAKAEAYLSTHGFTDLFLVTYFTSVFIAFLFGFCSEFLKPDKDSFRWYIGLARSGGYSLNLNSALVILLASRLFLTAIRDTAFAEVLPIDKAFPVLHIVIAYTVFFSIIVHVAFHMVWIPGSKDWEWGLWKINMTVITGFILLVVFVVMALFAMPSVRRKNFHLFYKVHMAGSTLFYIFLLLHGMHNAKPETYKWVAAPLIIYAAERFLRLFRCYITRLEVSANSLTFNDKNVLQLSVPKPFNFRPGQYAEIQVPSINREWHPFTIASAEFESDMSFYIKRLGDWTNALHAEFEDRLSETATRPIELFVRGPFGAPTQDVHKYSRIVLISGGIGATPFVSICKQLNHLHEEHNNKVHSDHLPQENETLMDDATEIRIRQAVKNIYDVDMDVLDIECTAENNQRERVAVQRMVHVADMLRGIAGSVCWFFQKSSPNDSEAAQPPRPGDDVESYIESTITTSRTPRESIASISTNPPTSFKDNMIRKLSSVRLQLASPNSLTEEEKRTRQEQAKLGDWRSNLLLALHSSRVTFILALICVARMTVIICASIFKSGFVRLHEPLAGGRWVALVYAILSTVITFVTVLTVLIEISLHQLASMNSAYRLLELIVLGPLSIVLTGLEFHRWATNNPGAPVLVFTQYILMQSITFMLVVGRMRRAVRRYGLLHLRNRSVHNKSPDHIPDADFVWTVSDDASDAWVRRELTPVALGRAVTLHRYVTKGSNPKDMKESIDVEHMEEGLHAVAALHGATKSGRPNWDQLLGATSRNTRSDGVVGIFFCGPKKMGDMVRAAGKKVEMWSNLRDAYLRSMSVGTLMKDIGLTDESQVLKLRDFGCRVRFVYHEENFSN